MCRSRAFRILFLLGAAFPAMTRGQEEDAAAPSYDYGNYQGQYGGQQYGNYPYYGNYSNYYPNYGNYSGYYGNYSNFDSGHPAQHEPCGGELTELQGQIITPGYPSSANPNGTYPPYKDCFWWRDGDDKTLVQVKFWDMEVEIGAGDSNVTCDFDYVNVTITSIGSKRFCGYHTPEEQYAGVGTLDIHFHSDDSMNLRGFVATYQITENYDPCQPNPCIYGYCDTNDAGTLPLCVCQEGYTGEQCEIDIRECNSEPCQNGGTCFEPRPNMYACTCPEGFEGDNCEIGGDGDSEGGNAEEGKKMGSTVTPCTSGPCKNGGTCSVHNETDYSCECRPFYEGDNCEIETGCKNPGIPQIADDERFGEGSTVQFSCDSGYEIVGKLDLTCLDDGTWSDEMPECVSDMSAAEKQQAEEARKGPWKQAMVGLGVALGITAGIFAMWMISQKPFMKVDRVVSLSTTNLKPPHLDKIDAVSLTSISISSDESDDEGMTGYSNKQYIAVP